MTEQERVDDIKIHMTRAFMVIEQFVIANRPQYEIEHSIKQLQELGVSAVQVLDRDTIYGKQIRDLMIDRLTRMWRVVDERGPHTFGVEGTKEIQALIEVQKGCYT
jgi:hypothetical protein